jgi:uncharacterized protein
MRLVPVLAAQGRFWPAPRTHGLVAASCVGVAVYLLGLGFAGASRATVAAVLVVGVAAFVSALAGFAFSAIAAAILFHFRRDHVDVVAALMVCSLANQGLSVWLLRRDIRPKAIAPFVFGGLIGVPIGIRLLLELNPRAFSATFGFLLIAYATYVLVRKPFKLTGTGLIFDVATGFAGGVIGGMTATPGAVVSIGCALKGWDKTRQRALFQPFTLIMQCAALIALAIFHGQNGSATAIPAFAWVCIPAGLLGTRWGMVLFKRMHDDHFAKAVNLLLIVSGFGLLA